ncbi:MAG: hypothetical protein GC203_11465 [Phenylobacterium sp.]|uniref:PilZ domain-containing protein n=1 Tax=Phenylobacterium sp. TaxID=1871053 RepID=UPI0025D67EDC|nr:PilZ domain-containing protein [Phenylobacterium sp.]MBI1198470.1 hypothetical protein [Phenylobacterium sp.]
MADPARQYIERRSEPREPVRQPARVLHGPKLALWADCTIRDLSRSGAKLEISHFYKLPPRFVLIQFQEARAIEVVLKWRRSDLAGVAFERIHPLQELEDQRLAPAREAWLALQSGLSR